MFLNIPYDADFENLFLAYISAISAFGFTPRATLEIPFGQRRLDRLLTLVQQSQYSIHDLSRVQLDRTSPRTPRFNMPFELGLTVALEKTTHRQHGWVLCESIRHRIKKSLSDLDGTDAYIHGGTVRGVFRELSNAFVGSSRQPTVTEMMQIYRVLRAQFSTILKKAGAKDAFNARVFKELCVSAKTAAEELMQLTGWVRDCRQRHFYVRPAIPIWVCDDARRVAHICDESVALEDYSFHSLGYSENKSFLAQV